MAVKDLYDKACEAANRGNYGYAIELYRQVLRLEPDYPSARLLLRGVERRRLGEKGPSFLQSLLNWLRGSGSLVKALLQRKDPKKRLEHCEDFLEKNPNSIRALRAAGMAAREAGFTEAAISIFKDIVSLQPQHMGALRQLGEVLEEAGQIKEAVKVAGTLSALEPTNREVIQWVSNLQAQQHITASKLDEAQSFRESIRDKNVAEVAERSVLKAGERRADQIRQACEALEKDPDNVTKITHLALLYEYEGNLEGSFRLLKGAHERMPANYELREKLGDMQLLIYDEAIRQVEKELRGDLENQELKDKLQQLRLGRKKRAAQEYGWRVQRHPTDLYLRLRHGGALFEIGDVDGAIQAFQMAIRESRLEEEAACMLGRCFAAKGQCDLAVEQYNRAIAKHPALDDRGMEMHYLLGQALEAMGNKEEAVKVYKRIYSHDIGFRDVANKIESLAR